MLRHKKIPYNFYHKYKLGLSFYCISMIMICLMIFKSKPKLVKKPQKPEAIIIEKIIDKGVYIYYSDNDLADSIYKAEGEEGASVPYGIMNVEVKDETEARTECLRIIREQRAYHKVHKCGKTYLRCLADRYAPIGAKNDNGTNIYWLKNVKYFLRHNEENK